MDLLPPRRRQARRIGFPQVNAALPARDEGALERPGERGRSGGRRPVLGPGAVVGGPVARFGPAVCAWGGAGRGRSRTATGSLPAVRA